jgi:hypothetical protein
MADSGPVISTQFQEYGWQNANNAADPVISLTGADRFVRKNFAIPRNAQTLPLPGTAETLGKTVQS